MSDMYNYHLSWDERHRTSDPEPDAVVKYCRDIRFMDDAEDVKAVEFVGDDTIVRVGITDESGPAFLRTAEEVYDKIRVDMSEMAAIMGAADSDGGDPPDDDELSERRRASRPDDFGEECPICGAAFDAGSSGFAWRVPQNSHDAVSWTRVCHGEPPGSEHEKVRTVPGGHFAPFLYVHKDEHADPMEADDAE